MNVTRDDAVTEARTWLGTPFLHQGALKGVACDCIGLVKGVGMALGLVDYDPVSPEALSYANYSMMPDSKRMRQGLARWLVPIPVDSALPADILFMAWGREPQHVALITDHGIIHSYSGVGKVVEHSLDDRWRQRIAAAYRYPAFKDA
ncbi:MAG: peptidase P60 [Alphaproteobacteria bacterium]|nr:MAG: peptidase P60 [Alphaproteobacteria bacterium]